MLGKGPDEFLMVDRAAPLFGNGLALLADQSRARSGRSACWRALVCDYVLMVACAADDYRMISRPR
ncbi:hypothetical protein PE067_19820 [Paracoccus sp. DMF-8]|uniref:hypothetical protein n=1 Tax=Paracoccus sp. DMF-8 TaxID=3019445 RepID=UPI0023E4586F|nr:hypothetical protein [Paracoccus sp. DMF-8]MDF3608188.1 hypothetical protein [Paracoccus sp. DMF-8]